MAITIRGQLERITYYNQENDYTVARLEVQGHKGLVTAVGKLSGVNPGETLELEGEWLYHRRFGRQFRFWRYRVLTPATLNAIEKYLSSGLIKGVGPILAKRIVCRFGMQTLEIIDKEIARLQEVEGVGPKRLEMIARAFAEQRQIRDIMLFLQSHGISATHAWKLYRAYGPETIAIVRQNPYRLALDISGIGFVTADKIALNLGIDPHSGMRAEAGILYVANQFIDEGHVYVPYDDLVSACVDALKIERQVIVEALGRLTHARRLVIETADGERCVYLPAYHTAEAGIARMLKLIATTPPRTEPIDSERALAWVQQRLGLQLAEKQKQAIALALQNKILVITGGPGTGKTTIVRAMLKILSQRTRRIVLTAPTGRAAKRLQEVTGWEAKTIHRLLQYNAAEGGFLRDQRNPLEADVVIVDEASMVDCLLMYHLLKALPPRARLIIVGDVDQLPSVGAGNVLRDIIDSQAFPVIRLSEIFRQSQGSLIITNAHRINSGQLPLVPADKSRLQDFYFISESDPQRIVQIIKELCASRIPNKLGFDPISDIQVLTPMHKGAVGTASLNAELQSSLNRCEVQVVRAGQVFRLYDKVMQIRNNYEKDVYNGDIGRIVDINGERQEVTVLYDSGQVKYSYGELDDVTLAYAVSVHKAQGSEYPVVIAPVITQHYAMLQRNLLYTAVTRAKRLVVLIGTRRALSIAVRNNRIQQRHTLLRLRLKDPYYG